MEDYDKEAEETVLISLMFKDGKQKTFILPTPPVINITEEEDKSISELMIPIVLEGAKFKPGLELSGCYVEFTNDPTPSVACGVTSLGYYSLRFALRDCTVVKLDPFTVQAKKPEFPDDGVIVRFTRPLRRVVK